MKIETKFDIGDEVFVAISKRYPEMHTCPACGGEGTWVGCDGDDYYCSKCSGGGKIEGKYKTEYVTRPLTIKSIAVHVKRCETDITYFPDGHLEKYLFTTEAEAQAECDRRNVTAKPEVE